MPRTPTTTMRNLVTRGPDGLTETDVARFVHLDDAREYCDWQAGRDGEVWRVRPAGKGRAGTLYSAGQGQA